MIAAIAKWQLQSGNLLLADPEEAFPASILHAGLQRFNDGPAAAIAR